MSFCLKGGIYGIVSAVVLAVGVSSCVVLGNADVTLVDGDMPTAVLVDNGMKDASALFTHLMERVSGTSLAVVSNRQEVATGRPAVVLRCADIPRAKGMSDDVYRQSYRIRTEPNALVIESPDPRGVLYGVAGFFADVLGCRFFRGDLEYIPQSKTVAVTKLDIAAAPSFPMRGNIWRVDFKDRWYQKMRAGGFPYNQLVAYHSLNDDLRRAAEAADLAAAVRAHPDWFAADEKGNRRSTWTMGVCGCSKTLPEALARSFVKTVRERLDEKRKRNRPVEATDYLIRSAQGDGFTPCLCAECRALVAREGTESAPIVQLMNRTLEIANREIPELRICTYAYFDTLLPPKTMPVNTNLCVCIVSSSLSHYQSGDQINEIETSPANHYYAEACRGWGRAAPGRVSVYHWDGPDFGNGLLVEWPSYFAHAKDMRFWHTCGIACPQAYAGTGGWGPFVSWLKYSQMWDITCDEWKLAEEFARCYYGKKAAPHLLEYWRTLDGARADFGYDPSIIRWYSWPEWRIEKLLTRPLLEKLEAVLDKAVAAADEDVDDPALRRVSDGAPASAFAETRLGARIRNVKPQHLDATWFEYAKREPYALVADPVTGAPWVVRDNIPDLIARIRRVEPHYRACFDGGKRNLDSEIRFGKLVSRLGSEAVPIRADGFETWYAPRLWGRLFSLKKDGVEIFANTPKGSGYADRLNVEYQWWPMTNGVTGCLSTRTEVVPEASAKARGNQWFDRTVEFVDGALSIRRAYEQVDCTKKPALRADTRFSSVWSLALPSVRRASVRIAGGGVEQALQPEEDMTLPIVRKEGALTVAIVRGDGLTVEIATEAKGFDSVRLRTDAEGHRLDVEFVGEPFNFRDPKLTGAMRLELPRQTLTVKGKLVEPIVSACDERPRQPARIRLVDADHAVNLADGAELVRIPAGAFWRGSKSGEGWSDERPQRKITLSEYWMYKEPIGFGTYTNVLARLAPGRRFNPGWDGWGLWDRSIPPERYPVQVTWFDADAYARFVGGRLPTEAQWEKGARGDRDARAYPWGDTWDGTKSVGWEQALEHTRYILKPTGTCPSGNSPYGLVDMAGNNFEWTNDWYAHDYYAVSPERDPQGPERGVHKVVRGGDSCYSASFHRCSARMLCEPDHRDLLKCAFRVVLEDPTVVDDASLADRASAILK